MIIDAYSHILPPAYFSRMREVAGGQAGLKRWLELPALHDVDERLAMMSEFGQDFQQILTLSSPPIEHLGSPDESPPLARLANESMRELCDQHPDRFPAFVAALPMNNPKAAVTEIGYAIDQLGACGVQMFTNVNGMSLDHGSLGPIFAELNRRGVSIWLHPTRSAAFSDYQSEDRSLYEIWWAFGWPYETSTAMARLVFSGLLDRNPNIRILTHHMGAMIPYLEGRIRLGWSDQFGSRTAENQYSSVVDQLEHDPIDYFRSFYADTAISGSEIAVRCGLEFFGSDRVIFGSDCPFDPEGGPLFIREMIRIIDRLPITEEVRRAIYAGNVRKFADIE